MRLSRLAVCASVLASGFFFSANASASTIDVFIESVSVSSAATITTGHLDVYITEPSTNSSLSYNAEVDLSSTSGVIFLAPSSNTSSHTPAYPPTNFFAITNNGVIQVANDTSPAITLHNNDGLFQVNFQVAANASGVFNLTFNPADTQIFDNNNQPISLALHGGTITVAAPVPEPASLALLGLLAPLVLRRRRASR